MTKRSVHSHVFTLCSLFDFALFLAINRAICTVLTCKSTGLPIILIDRSVLIVI